MSRLAVFGLGVLCGIVLQTMLILLYCSLIVNNIDKK